jgi:glycosyltransferase involved in cell wall biosynthesis
VIQKEASFIDKYFTKSALGKVKTFITHAYKTVEELKELFPKEQFLITLDGKRNIENKNVLKLYHPIYDLFQPDDNLDIATTKKELNLRKHVFLFFGFIRKYKGLHHTIRAFKIVADQRDDVSLLICGESFWKTLDSTKFSTKIKTAIFNILKSILTKNKENEQDYNPLTLIEELGLSNKTTVVNKFIPNEDVAKYFQVSDAVVLFYEYATPSGIESLSYNFKKPLLTTKVGHFPETIEDGYNGYLAEKDDIYGMANIMLKYLDNPLPSANVEEKTKEMSWDNYAKAILY